MRKCVNVLLEYSGTFGYEVSTWAGIKYPGWDRLKLDQTRSLLDAIVGNPAKFRNKV